MSNKQNKTNVFEIYWNVYMKHAKVNITLANCSTYTLFPLGKLVFDQFKFTTICVHHGSPYESSI